MPLKKIWNEIVKNLGSVIPKSEIDTWFINTECIKMDENSAVIEVPNKFIAVWLHDNYYDVIKTSIKKITKKNLELQFDYNKNNNCDISNNNQNKLLFNNLNKLMKFNNFITGDCNLFAYSSSVAIAENPGGYYNPFYIFSKHGIGKTHLLNSIGNKLNKNQLNISYINSKNFILDYSNLSKNKIFDCFKERYINLDVLLFDDIQYLSNSSRLQDEFISILDYFCLKKRQIVITGDRAPAEYNKFNAQLKSRIGSGLLAEIKETDVKTKSKIIKTIIKNKNLPIEDDILLFLVKSNDDIKKIIKNIIRIETYYSLNKGNLNLSLVKSIIKDRYDINVGIEEIQSVIAGYFNISTNDILSEKKRSIYTYPRHLAMYMARNLTDLSYKEIGYFFGDRDHSSVVYATKKIEQSIKKNKEVEKDINNIKNLLT
jgi:chromosomal replication initiator protein